jgi:PAS domain S-box-containing protein
VWLAQVVAVAAAYYVAARIGLSLALPPGHATAVWPPSGIALAAILLLGYRASPGVWLGAFMANIQDLAGGATAADLADSVLVAASIGFGSTLQALIAAGLIRGFTDYRSPFQRSADVFRFAGIAAICYPLGAIIGVTSLCVGGFVPWDAYDDNLRTWWLGDLAGVLIVAPLILVWSRRVPWSRREAMETGAVLALACAASTLVFGGVLPDASGRMTLSFVVIPFVVWAGFRLGQHAVVLVTVAISLIATVGAAEGTSAFSGMTENTALLTLQAFVGVITITGLALAAAVAERERAAERFRVLVQAAPEAIVMVDQAGRIAQLNPQMERLFGYSRDELLGEQVERLVPRPFQSEHHLHRTGFYVEPQVRAMGAGRDLFGLRKNGSEFPVEIGLGPIITDEGTFVIAVIVDITERKQTEAVARQYAEDLARSNADLEQYAYVASHDLQEPLRMVTGYCDLLQRRYKGRLDKDADDFIDFAVEGANRMRALVQDLLAYARVSGESTQTEQVDCNQAFERALANLKGAVKDSNALVTSSRLPAVNADASQIEQLFQNLIANSIKFRGAESPVIQLGAEGRNGSWLFSVSDNGIGVETRHSERVFEMFQRLHRRQDYAGTGVGLAICKKIVERHGGRIWLKSQPGEGSTFYFTLPRSQSVGEDA